MTELFISKAEHTPCDFGDDLDVSNQSSTHTVWLNLILGSHGSYNRDHAHDWGAPTVRETRSSHSAGLCCDPGLLPPSSHINKQCVLADWSHNKLSMSHNKSSDGLWILKMQTTLWVLAIRLHNPGNRDWCVPAIEEEMTKHIYSKVRTMIETSAATGFQIKFS